MRIAFFCKRRYMGKDVIRDRYARMYEIPYQLAKLGHRVHGFCLDYHGGADEDAVHLCAAGKLRWASRSLQGLQLLRFTGHRRWLLTRLQRFAPDVLIGASDIPHITLAALVARYLQRPYAVDLYDNFESFGQARLPGMKSALRRAVRHAGLVSTTSAALHDRVDAAYGPTGKLITMPSTVDLTVFRPRDRRAARDALKLPREAKLIGTAGGLYADKGVDTLYQAWKRLALRHPHVHLVLAGPYHKRLPPPRSPRVHYLGELPHARTAELFAALDVGIIYLRDTPFGRYCFPQKAYEMLACQLPVVAAAVGAMLPLLAQAPAQLYRPDDPNDLSRAIEIQLQQPHRICLAIDDWASTIKRLEPHLCALAPAALSKQISHGQIYR